MATELLERIVIPYLKQEDFKFDVDDDKIRFSFTSSGIRFSIVVIDMENHDPLFRIIADGIVRFDRKQRSAALRLTNLLNGKIIGKFVLTDELYMVYALETCVQKTCGPEAFKDALEYAVIPVVRYYPAIMRVRWANMPIRMAMRRQPFDRIASKLRDKSTQNTPESPASDDVIEMLERSFAEDDEGQEKEEDKE